MAVKSSLKFEVPDEIEEIKSNLLRLRAFKGTDDLHSPLTAADFNHFTRGDTVEVFFLSDLGIDGKRERQVLECLFPSGHPVTFGYAVQEEGGMRIVSDSDIEAKVRTLLEIHACGRANRVNPPVMPTVRAERGRMVSVSLMSFARDVQRNEAVLEMLNEVIDDEYDTLPASPLPTP
jgi:hypothetical protein